MALCTDTNTSSWSTELCKPLFMTDQRALADTPSGFISLIPVVLFLPSHITTARFLTDEQKFLALERIRLNNTGTQNTKFKWKQVFECLTDLKQWMFVIMVFCASLVSGGISAFGPIVLGGFGLDPYETILYNTIPGAIGIVANLM